MVVFTVVVVSFLVVVVSNAVVVVVSSVVVVVSSVVVVISVVVVEEMDTSCGTDSSGTGGVSPQAASRVIQRNTQKTGTPIRFIHILLYIMAVHLYTRKTERFGYINAKNTYFSH